MSNDVSNDELRHEFEHVFAVMQDQMKDLSALQEKQATLKATGVAADGAVRVTVNAGRMISETVIDVSYLEDYEFGELAGHVTQAAQQAAADLGRRSEALLAPLRDRRSELDGESLSSLAVPGLREALDQLRSLQAPRTGAVTGDGERGASSTPSVRG